MSEETKTKKKHGPIFYILIIAVGLLLLKGWTDMQEARERVPSTASLKTRMNEFTMSDDMTGMVDALRAFDSTGEWAFSADNSSELYTDAGGIATWTGRAEFLEPNKPAYTAQVIIGFELDSVDTETFNVYISDFAVDEYIWANGDSGFDAILDVFFGNEDFAVSSVITDYWTGATAMVAVGKVGTLQGRDIYGEDGLLNESNERYEEEIANQPKTESYRRELGNNSAAILEITSYRNQNDEYVKQARLIYLVGDTVFDQYDGIIIDEGDFIHYHFTDEMTNTTFNLRVSGLDYEITPSDSSLNDIFSGIYHY